MKNVFLIYAILVCMCANSQDKGIHFENNTDWVKIVAKAKLEKKFIFIDFYTTWCGPCRAMSTQIFPLEEVGDFYNKNFINLKLQYDSTQNDNEEVKNWHPLANKFFKQFNIAIYPTFLYFNSNGEIVHKVVGGSLTKDFIERGKNAIDTEKQYYNLKEQYENGKRDTSFLYNLIKVSKSAYETEFYKKVCFEYLNTQQNLYTKKNIDLLKISVSNSSDFGFQIIMDNSKRVDSFLGKGVATAFVNNIIVQEEVNPKINNADTINWNSLKYILKTKYPNNVNEIFYIAKVNYERKKKNWLAFSNAITNYLSKYEDKLPFYKLNEYAFDIFLYCNNKIILKNALIWSKKSFSNLSKINPDYVDTYANLLYKLGRKNAALNWEQKAQKIAIEHGADKSWNQDIIDKMKKGEKTW